MFEGSPAEIQVDISKKGRRFTFVRAQLKQKGAVCLDANGCYSSVASSKGGMDYLTKPFEKSSLPAFEQCKQYEEVGAREKHQDEDALIRILFQQLMTELGVYPPSAARENDFRIRAVDPVAVGAVIKKYGAQLDQLTAKAGPKEIAALGGEEILNAKMEAYVGFTDKRPMDVTSSIYFTGWFGLGSRFGEVGQSLCLSLPQTTSSL